MQTIEIKVPDGYKGDIEYVGETKIIINFNKKVDKNKEMEDFLKAFLTDLTIIIIPEYPNSVYYKQNSEVIFELYQNPNNKEERYFYVDYKKIWAVFNDRFELNYKEIQQFIKGAVEDTLKIGSIRPSNALIPPPYGWETPYKDFKTKNEIIIPVRMTD